MGKLEKWKNGKVWRTNGWSRAQCAGGAQCHEGLALRYSALPASFPLGFSPYFLTILKAILLPVLTPFLTLFLTMGGGGRQAKTPNEFLASKPATTGASQ
jgi:hypothetical protein